MNSDITVKLTEQSNLDAVDCNNLSFGSIFSDHMFVCDFKDGAWQQPAIVPYAPIWTSVQFLKTL